VSTPDGWDEAPRSPRTCLHCGALMRIGGDLESELLLARDLADAEMALEWEGRS
jgi:hypothetical protein